jgi:hypothetical protein
MRRLSPPPFSRLVGSVGRVGVLGSPVVVAAGIGLLGLRRAPPDAWTVGAAVWLVAATIAMLAQQWWSYQTLALLVPLGLLAGEPLSRVLRGSRQCLIAAVLVVALAIASNPGYARALLRHGPDRSAIAADLGDGVQDRADADAFLAAPGRIAGDVYVFGNPVILDGIGRGQPISIHGWSPEFYDSTTWSRLTAELAARPPAYLFVDDFSKRYIRERAPGLWSWIGQRYVAEDSLPSGIAIFRRGS